MPCTTPSQAPGIIAAPSDFTCSIALAAALLSSRTTRVLVRLLLCALGLQPPFMFLCESPLSLQPPYATPRLERFQAEVGFLDVDPACNRAVVTLYI